MRHISNLVFIFTFPLYSFSELEFWPSEVITLSPEESGTLYSWPQFFVPLQYLKKEGYEWANIDDEEASQLNEIFFTNNSLIRSFRKGQAWGLYIPGGNVLQPSNIEMLEPMLKDYAACLSSLSEEEVDYMSSIIETPQILSNGNRLSNDAEAKKIATKMFRNYVDTRCKKHRTKVPLGLINKMRTYIKAFLIGNTFSAPVYEPILLNISVLHYELFFSVKGIWTRVALQKIKDFVIDRLKTFPVLEDNYLKNNYKNFIDYIVSTRREMNFSRNHYLQMANINDINSLLSIFHEFPLSSWLKKGKIKHLHLAIGRQKASLFLKGKKNV